MEFMRISGFSEAQGDLVGLKTVNELHIGDGMRMQGKGEKVVSSFAESFNNAIAEVNDLEIRSTELATQMAVDPESVDIHDVQIALKKQKWRY